MKKLNLIAVALFGAAAFAAPSFADEPPELLPSPVASTTDEPTATESLEAELAAPWEGPLLLAFLDAPPSRFETEALDRLARWYPVEIVRVDLNGVPRLRQPLDVATLDEYAKAGLRRVRYVAAPLEIARQFAERVRLAANPNSTDSTGSTDSTLSPADAVEVAANREQYLTYNDAIPTVAPTPSAENWLAQLRIDVGWVLVDADGKTLAAYPKRPKNRDDAPEIGDTLKQLFPNVANGTAK